MKQQYNVATQIQTAAASGKRTTKTQFMRKLLLPLLVAFAFMVGMPMVSNAQTSTLGSTYQLTGGGPLGIGKTQVISQFSIAQTTSTTNLTSVAVTSTGTYTSSDITSISLYETSTGTFSGATLVKSLTPASTGTGETFTFNPTPYSLSVATHYFYIVATVSSSATAGRTIALGTMATGKFSVSSGSVAGSTIPATGTFTIVNTSTNFTLGNIVSTVTSNTASNTIPFLFEGSPSGGTTIATNSYPIGSTTSNTVSLGGSATTTGLVSLSNDRSSLLFLAPDGYNISASAGNILKRDVVSINNSRTVSLPFNITSTSGSTARGATTIDNTNYWVSDQGSYSTYSNGGSQVTNNTLNIRPVKSFGGNVYTLTQITTAGISVIEQLSFSAGSIVETPLTGLTTDATAMDFYMVSSQNNSTYDIIYTTTTGGIKKYVLNAGSWALSGSLYTVSGGLNGICAKSNGTSIDIYATTGSGGGSANAITKLNDAPSSGGLLGTANFTTTAATLYSSPANTTFKGIDFAPYTYPTITAQPTSTQSVYQNVAASNLSVTAAAGSGALSTYAWYYNTSNANTGGTAITSGNSATYGTGYNTSTLTPNTATVGTLYYYCVVTDANGATVTSNTAAVIVSTPPVGYYWNGGNAGSTSITGGSGNWTGTTNGWVVSSGPTAATWADGNAAIFSGTAGNVTLGVNTTTTTTVAPTSVEFATTNYSLYPYPASSKYNQITSNVTVDAGLNLNVFNPATTSLQYIALSGNLTGGTGSSLTLQGQPQGTAGAVNVASLFELTGTNPIVSIPTVNIAAGTAPTTGNAPGVIGFEAFGTNATISSNIVNNNASGSYPLMLGEYTTSDILTVSGNISGTGDVQISSNYSTGYGATLLSGTNTYLGVTYIGGNGSSTTSVTNATLKLGSANALPSTTSVIFGNPNSSFTIAGNLDLNGYNTSIVDLYSTPSKITSTVTVTPTSVFNTSATAGTITLTNPSSSNSMTVPINDGTGKVGLAITGGTFTLAKASSFSGGLSVSGGGTFKTGVTTAFSGSPALSLSNGTYSTGASTGYSATLGTLSVGASNATIALGTGVHTLTFSDSHSLTWGAGNLTITGWTGYGFSGGTAGKIMVGVGGLSSSQLGKITFSGYSGTPMILSTGELVPYYASPNITGQPSTGTQTVCQNGSLTALSVTASAGSAAISTYQWYSNTTASTSGATAVSTGTGYTTNTFTPSTTVANTLYYYCVVTDVNGATSTSGFSGLITVNTNQTPTVTITPTAYSTCSASTTPIAFTINATTYAGAGPNYAWYQNGTQKATGTSWSPLPSTFTNGDQVYAILTSNYTCLTQSTAQSTSATVTITSSTTPSVAVSNSVTNSVSATATICSGTSVTFTATPTNGGTTPSYQWYDGSTAVGTNSATYTTTSLSNNDQIKVVLTSSDVCASPTTATSAITTITVNALTTPSVTIAASANPICTGTSVTFTPTPTNGGASPTYVWYKTGAVQLSTSSTYTSSPTSSVGIYAVLTPSGDACPSTPTATSSTTNLTVNTALPTIGTITANSGAIYSGQSLALGITNVTPATTIAAYQWYDNAVAITGATAATYTTTSFATGTHPLTLKVTDANACAATSAPQSISVLAPIAFTAGNIVVERVGDNATASTGSAASKIFIDQYNTTGTAQTPISSVALPWSIGTSTYPTYPSAPNYSLTTSESATSEGFLTLSSDGSYLSIPGYNAYYNEAGIASTTCSAANTSNYRAIGVVGSNGVATVPIAANMLSGNNIRGVVSDGSQFWANGAAGFYYFTSTSDNSGTQYAGTNLRALGIFNGTLYVTSATSPYVGLNTLGTTASLHDNGTVSQQVIAPSTAGTSGTSPYGFVFNPTGDILYIADDAAGISKYTSTDGVNYTFQYVLTTTKARGLIGDFSGTNPILYATTASATTGNTIIKVTDAGSAGATPTTLATATASNTVFKGIAWAPAATQNSYLYVNKTFRGTAFNAAFGSSTIGTAVTNSGANYFGLASKFIPASATVTVKPPVGYEISTSAAFGAGSVYTNSSPLTISGASLAESSSSSIYQIYVRFRPTISGAQNGTITITSDDGHTAQATVSVTGSGLLPTTYYYSGSGSLTAPGSYKDGLGNTCLESSISNTGITWYIQNSGSYTLTAPFTLGTNSTLYVGGGTGTTTLTVGSGAAISGGLGINLGSTGVLNWNDATTPSFANIASGSTVNYGGVGISQTIAVGNYSNITFSGTGARVFSATTYTIDNNFSVGTGNTVTTTGSTIYFNGTAAQNVPGITYNNLTLSSNTTTTATGNITVNGTLYIEQGTFTIPYGYTYTQLGSVVTVGSVGNTCSLTVNGTFNNGSSTVAAATISITTGSSISFNASTSIYNHLGNGGSIPKATWNAASTATISGITSTAPASGFAQTFGTFTWNCASQTTPVYINTASFTTSGSFNIASTGTSYLALLGTTATTVSNSFPSISLTGGTFYTSYISSATNNCTENLTVTGNFTVSGTAVVNLAGGSASPTYSSIVYPTNLTIGGNLTVASTASFIAYNNTTTYGTFNHGKVTFTNSATLSNANTPTGYGHIDYIVSSGKTLTLNSNVTQRASSSTEFDAFTNNGTINLNGYTLTTTGYTGGTITGSTTSGLVVNGYANASLNLDQGTPGTTNALNTLTTGTSGTVTISNTLNITGILTVSTGSTLDMGTGKVTLKSTSITKSAVVGTGGGTIKGTATVERYIPMGYRSYRDMAPEVYGAGSIYTNWQENGNTSSTTGIFITGPSATASTAGFPGTPASTSSPNPAPSSGSNYLDYSPNGIYSAYIFSNSQAKYGYLGFGTTGSNNYSPSAITNTNNVTLDPFLGYRVLIRGARDFNLFSTPIIKYAGGLIMNSATTLRATGGLVYGNVIYNTTNVTGTASNGTSATASGSVSSTNVLNPNVGGWSMVANPYVCPVDWTLLYTPANISAATTYPIKESYFYFDPTYGEKGVWIGYNKFTGSPYNGSNTRQGQYIQPGQAFLIQNNTTSLGSAPTLTFTEASKATSPSSHLAASFGTTNQLSKIYVSLFGKDANDYTIKDGAAVAFRSDFGNTAYGPQDAIKLSNASDNLYISDKSKNLSIDGRLPATATDVIALAISKPSTTNYQLKVDATDYINEGYTPVIYDSYKKTTTAIASVDSLTFTIDTAVAATYANRFSIVFSPTALPVNSIVASASLNNKAATITWNTVGEKNVARYEVEKSVDAKTFTKIGQATAKNTATANYSTTENNVTATTYYRIKAVSTTGSISYSNVAKVQLAVNSNQFAVYPNPLVGKTLNVSLSGVNVGKYTVSIYNVLGEKVSEQSINHEGGSASHAITISNTLARGTYSVTVREAASDKQVYQTNLSVQP